MKLRGNAVFQTVKFETLKYYIFVYSLFFHRILNLCRFSFGKHKKEKCVLRLMLKLLIELTQLSNNRTITMNIILKENNLWISNYNLKALYTKQ